MEILVVFAIAFALVTLRPRYSGIARRPYGNRYTDAPGALDR
jgi:hypothetical protein